MTLAYPPMSRYRTRALSRLWRISGIEVTSHLSEELVGLYDDHQTLCRGESSKPTQELLFVGHPAGGTLQHGKSVCLGFLTLSAQSLLRFHDLDRFSSQKLHPRRPQHEPRIARSLLNLLIDAVNIIPWVGVTSGPPATLPDPSSPPS
ncbi:MAG: hypothetical protein V3W28_03290 [Thermoplasmata archaeon]